MPKYIVLVASDPSPESIPRLSEITRHGISGIFTFPFSLKGNSDLGIVEGQTEQFRYRFYEPFVINEGQPRLHPDAPLDRWPSFEWSSEVPEIETLKSPTTITLEGDGEGSAQHLNFDGMRIDVFGDIDGVERELLRVSKSFLDWLRCYSGQPWINTFEYHFESKLKHQFAIDLDARCVENPRARVEFVKTDFSEITREIFASSVDKAISGADIPQYFTVFFDAQNSFARDNFWECALYLSLCIDMARHILFLGKFPNSIRNNTVIFNNRELEHTDLLRVLGRTLDNQCGRNLERELPDVWTSFKNLFLTRHQIAHGKNKANVNGQLVELNADLVESWIKTAIEVIMFIEDVCDAPVKFQMHRQRH